jgi:hypothetical protein
MGLEGATQWPPVSFQYSNGAFDFYGCNLSGHLVPVS